MEDVTWPEQSATWIETQLAEHPQIGRRYAQMVDQPDEVVSSGYWVPHEAHNLEEVS